MGLQTLLNKVRAMEVKRPALQRIRVKGGLPPTVSAPSQHSPSTTDGLVLTKRDHGQQPFWETQSAAALRAESEAERAGRTAALKQEAAEALACQKATQEP